MKKQQNDTPSGLYDFHKEDIINDKTLSQEDREKALEFLEKMESVKIHRDNVLNDMSYYQAMREDMAGVTEIEGVYEKILGMYIDYDLGVVPGKNHPRANPFVGKSVTIKDKLTWRKLISRFIGLFVPTYTKVTYRIITKEGQELNYSVFHKTPKQAERDINAFYSESAKEDSPVEHAVVTWTLDVVR
jgi:hypothetical protein